MTHEFDTIETPENVELHRLLAGPGSRLLAGLIDTLWLMLLYLCLFLLWLFIFLAAGFSGSFETIMSSWLVAALIVGGFLIYWGYFLIFEFKKNGQTPGKKYVRIRVVDEDGGPVSFRAIAVRNLLRVVDGIGFYAIGGAVMFFTSRSQRLGDLAAGTVIVCEGRTDYSAQPDRRRKAPPVEVAAPTPEQLESSLLTPEEYRLLINYWARRHQLSLQARGNLLPQLLHPVLERLGEPLPKGTVAQMERRLGELIGRKPPAYKIKRRDQKAERSSES